MVSVNTRQFGKMAANDEIDLGVEVEFIDDEEFRLLDEAVENAMGEADTTKNKFNRTTRTADSKLTPLERYRGDKGYLSVTTLASQFWCEQQMEYSFTAPETTTPKAVQQGTDIHLARELELYDKVPVNISSNEDKWAVICLNCLMQVAALDAQQRVRELPVFGDPFNLGMFVFGVIDELQFDDKGQIKLVELKTRTGSASLPSNAQQQRTVLQVMVYTTLFNDLLGGKVTTEMFLKKLNLSGHSQLSEDPIKFAAQLGLSRYSVLKDLVEMLLSRFQSLEIPKIESAEVEYVSQENCEVLFRTVINYEESWLRAQLASMLVYWRGERAATGVDIEEAWKCRRCEFADTCEWRSKKDEECRKANKSAT